MFTDPPLLWLQIKDTSLNPKMSAFWRFLTLNQPLTFEDRLPLADKIENLQIPRCFLYFSSIIWALKFTGRNKSIIPILDQNR